MLEIRQICPACSKVFQNSETLKIHRGRTPACFDAKKQKRIAQNKERKEKLSGATTTTTSKSEKQNKNSETSMVVENQEDQHQISNEKDEDENSD